MKQNLIDHAEFEVKAGNGGNGAVSFLRNKQTRKGGPDGGDGGNGGSIWFEADRNLSTLRFFAGRDRFRAQHGENGGARNWHGENASEMTIKVPVGTTIWGVGARLPRPMEKGGETPPLRKDRVIIADLSLHGQRELIAKGGKGGRGNKAFASSTNTTPMEAEQGERGEKKLIQLELKVLADVGLIGLPNVGKSTLLSVLTQARPEIADYPFTTLSPNLGVMGEFHPRGEKRSHLGGEGQGRQIVIADIPGLIEDASSGKGLGIDFLKHVERCRVLVHVLALDVGARLPRPMEKGGETPPLQAKILWNNYLVVRQELGAFNPELLTKKEIVVVNKADILSEQARDRISAQWEQKNIKIFLVSAVTHQGLDNLRQEIQRMLVEG